MRTISCSILILALLLSCSSSSGIPKPKIQPQIPTAKLNEKGIIPINHSYKQLYFRLLPYLFFNGNGKYNEIQGDFYNVKFNNSSNINIMSGVWRDYGSYKNSLIVLIAMSETSTIPIKNIPISVKSSKNGNFSKGELTGNNEINQLQQRVLFVKKLNLENKYDVLNKVNDDIITVKIGEQIYEFLNPELKLE